MIKSIFASMILALCAGCASAITNLTPSELKRPATGMVLFEAAFDTNERTVQRDSIKPYVVIGSEFHPMKPGPVLKDRWETLVEIPATNKTVFYHFKVDYDYDAIPQPKSGSRLSPPYRLEILEP